VAFPEVSGFGMVFTANAALQIWSIGRLHLRLPVSVVRLDFPAGAQVSESALGNLELGLERSLELGRAARFGLRAALIAPSAEHGPETALLENRALALGRDRNRRVQPVVEPGLHLRSGRHVALGLDASIPVAGNLGGDAFSVGLYGRFDF
jgi:hypothetical protein